MHWFKMLRQKKTLYIFLQMRTIPCKRIWWRFCHPGHVVNPKKGWRQKQLDFIKSSCFTFFNLFKMVFFLKYKNKLISRLLPNALFVGDFMMTCFSETATFLSFNYFYWRLTFNFHLAHYYKKLYVSSTPFKKRSTWSRNNFFFATTKK